MGRKSSSLLTKNIWINVAAGDIVQQVRTVLVLLANLRNSLFFSLDKKYPLVTEVTRPVCVDLGQDRRGLRIERKLGQTLSTDLELSANVLRQHQDLLSS